MDLRHLANLSPVDYAVPGFVLLVLAEIIVARLRDRSRYEPKDTLTSLALGLGSTIAGILTGGLFVAIALWIYQYRLFEIGYTWWAFLIVFVLDDFVYYWVHRAGHRIRWAWAAHVIHHSSQHYNLSTALRQTWTGFFGATFILKLPLFLIGFPVPMVAFVGGINLIYQFWIHTEVIGRMPRWFESVMNTPSHHRVHHATNPRYLDMNYAGVFIVWDKMFGTFTPELDTEKPRYGIVKNLGSFNLVWAAFHEWVGIAKDVWAAPTLRAKLNYMIKPPGWSHDGSRETSESIKELWEQRERERDAWNKPTSSSSGADRAAPPPRAGSAKAAATR
jgi:sterol desaturase/sphingolipid hydroxylase (fatty acid hydroxylase superfamily)